MIHDFYFRSVTFTKGLPWWFSGKESCSAGDVEMGVWLLGWEDPLEEEMASHSSFCLGHPVDRGARWAIVPGIAKESDIIWQLNNNIY